MTTNHPQFGLMCEISHHGLTPDQCAEDTNGQKWDICKGDCARQAGIEERVTTTHRVGRSWHVTIVEQRDGQPDQLHAIVMAGKVLTTDAQLAERVCALLSRDDQHHPNPPYPPFCSCGFCGPDPTPDVSWTRGAAEALAEVARRLTHASKLGEEITEADVFRMLRDAAASLGVDEDAPPSPLSAPVTAQQPPTVGQDRPDANSGSQARTVECKLVRLAGPGPTDPCDCFVWQPCAMQHPREPERKADQA